MGRVPGGVKDDHAVGALQVDTKATSPGRDQEESQSARKQIV